MLFLRLEYFFISIAKEKFLPAPTKKINHEILTEFLTCICNGINDLNPLSYQISPTAPNRKCKRKSAAEINAQIFIILQYEVPLYNNWNMPKEVKRGHVPCQQFPWKTDAACEHLPYSTAAICDISKSLVHFPSWFSFSLRARLIPDTSCPARRWQLTVREEERRDGCLLSKAALFIVTTLSRHKIRSAKITPQRNFVSALLSFCFFTLQCLKYSDNRRLYHVTQAMGNLVIDRPDVWTSIRNHRDTALGTACSGNVMSVTEFYR